MEILLLLAFLYLLYLVLKAALLWLLLPLGLIPLYYGISALVRAAQTRTRRRAVAELRAAVRNNSCLSLMHQFIERHRYSATWPMQEVDMLCHLLMSHNVATTPSVLLDVLRAEHEEMKYEGFKTRMDSLDVSALHPAVTAFVRVYGDQYTHHMKRFVRYAIERWPEDSAYYFEIDEMAKTAARQLSVEMFANALSSSSDAHMTIDDIDLMSGYQFEDVLARLYSGMGYEVSRTRASRDQGADLILTRLGERAVVQAKRYDCKVSNKAIQEVVAARAHYQATRAIVATSSYFTPAASQLARSNCVELVDRDELARLLRQHAFKDAV